LILSFTALFPQKVSTYYIQILNWFNRPLSFYVEIYLSLPILYTNCIGYDLKKIWRYRPEAKAHPRALACGKGEEKKPFLPDDKGAFLIPTPLGRRAVIS
jgi:hypothetical protein